MGRNGEVGEGKARGIPFIRMKDKKGKVYPREENLHPLFVRLIINYLSN